MRRRIPLALTALLLLTCTATAGAAKPRDLLPDLAQGSPTGVDTLLDETTGAPRLVFDSTIGNVGEGPLILTARRRPGEKRMTAHQVIRRSDGSRRTVRKVAGVLEFVQASDHQHWHLLGIDRYELWTGDASRRLRRDRKQGFCLGDRYQLSPNKRMPHQPRLPAYPGYCGKDRPDLLTMVEGITVGWGDNYPANIEGQYIDIGGIAPGSYLLVHRIRAGGLIESYPYNDVSCAAIELGAAPAADQPPPVTVSPKSRACDTTYRRWGVRG